MPKSKHRKNHQDRLNKYKADKKKEKEVFKKKMIDNYIKMQQENLANKEEHTSVEEVVGPDINIDDLNVITDWDSTLEVEPLESIVDIDPVYIPSLDYQPTNIATNDNNNQ